MHMELNKKKMYLTPECEEFELRLEGVIALSGEPQNYVDPFGGSELTF